MLEHKNQLLLNNLMHKPLVLLQAFLFAFIVSTSPIVHAQSLNEPPSVSVNETNSVLTNETPSVLVLDTSSFISNSQVMIQTFEATTVQELQNYLHETSLKKSDLIISTDRYDVANVAAHYLEKQKEQASEQEIRLIPYGELLQKNFTERSPQSLKDLKENFKSGYKTYIENVKHTFRSDKIGLTVVAITTAYDSLIWIHSTDVTLQQQTSMIMMNVMMAAAFGLDRDLWTRMTVPLRHKLITTFDRYGGNLMKNKETLKLVTSQFLANMGFSVAFQFLRGSLLSFENLTAAASSPEFYGKALLIGSLMTFSGFAWSELLAAINTEKNPVAKSNLKRLGDLRTVLMSQFASIGMVFQPNTYGYTPLVAFIVHGGLGLLGYLKKEKVVSFLENNKSSLNIYKYQMKFEELSQHPALKPRALMCSGLF